LADTKGANLENVEAVQGREKDEWDQGWWLLPSALSGAVAWVGLFIWIF
jgi:hypothetical protein